MTKVYKFFEINKFRCEQKKHEFDRYINKVLKIRYSMSGMDN